MKRLIIRTKIGELAEFDVLIILNGCEIYEVNRLQSTKRLHPTVYLMLRTYLRGAYRVGRQRQHSLHRTKLTPTSGCDDKISRESARRGCSVNARPRLTHRQRHVSYSEKNMRPWAWPKKHGRKPRVSISSWIYANTKTKLNISTHTKHDDII